MNILILGVNGQDGSFLAEAFLALTPHEVYGVGRTESSRWLPADIERYNYIQADLSDPVSLGLVLNNISPDAIFNFAAVHGPSGFNYDQSLATLIDVNFRSNCLILEYIKSHAPDCFYLYASSSKVFSHNVQLITEETDEQVTCLYSLTKISSRNAIEFYRNSYGVRASVVWLFNHESDRRPPGFFFTKVANILWCALNNTPPTETLSGDVGFWCDWGDASEYMIFIVKHFKDLVSKDFILASGVTVNAANVIRGAFGHYGLCAEKYIPNLAKETLIPPPWRAKSLVLEYMNIDAPSRGFFDVLIQHIDSRLLLHEKG